MEIHDGTQLFGLPDELFGMFRVAWLALAVVAAAHEHKAAKVHHTATGQPARRLGRTAELSVITDDLHLKLNLEADFGAFHRSYKELSMGPDGTSTTRAGARGGGAVLSLIHI